MLKKKIDVEAKLFEAKLCVTDEFAKKIINLQKRSKVDRKVHV